MMKVKKDAETYYTGEFMYDLIDGGYIEPDKFLEDEKDIQKVEDALSVIREFRSTLEHNDLIGEM